MFKTPTILKSKVYSGEGHYAVPLCRPKWLNCHFGQVCGPSPENGSALHDAFVSDCFTLGIWKRKAPVPVTPGTRGSLAVLVKSPSMMSSIKITPKNPPSPSTVLSVTERDAAASSPLRVCTLLASQEGPLAFLFLIRSSLFFFNHHCSECTHLGLNWAS